MSRTIPIKEQESITNDRLLLVVAYTDGFKPNDYTDISYKKWILNTPSPYGSQVVSLDFTESTKCLRIILEDGTEIIKYNVATLIYKPYAEARKIYYKEESL